MNAGYSNVQIVGPALPKTRVTDGTSYVVWEDADTHTHICLSSMTGDELRTLAEHLDEFSYEVDEARREQFHAERATA